MKLSRAPFFALLALVPAAAHLLAQEALIPSPQVLAAFATQVKEAGKKKAAAVAGTDGWFFLTSELRFLSLEHFWGAGAAKVSRSPKPDIADPLVAIIDFQKQLKAKGIDLLVVPVPPKAAIYPEKIIGEKQETAALAPLRNFQAELTKAGVEVLELGPAFLAMRDASPTVSSYCRTDTHWSPAGCETAAKAIAGWVAQKCGPPAADNPFQAKSAELEIEGDLGALLPSGAPKPAKETLQLRQITTDSGKALDADPASPVLLLGDSHTLVFHEFAGEKAGLLDQLAYELHAVPDLIGTRGSGSTAVRINLYRKSVKDAEYLSKKKAVIWCFTAREFTESDQGWAKVPISK